MCYSTFKKKGTLLGRLHANNLHAAQDKKKKHVHVMHASNACSTQFFFVKKKEGKHALCSLQRALQRAQSSLQSARACTHASSMRAMAILVSGQQPPATMSRRLQGKFFFFLGVKVSLIWDCEIE